MKPRLENVSSWSACADICWSEFLCSDWSWRQDLRTCDLLGGHQGYGYNNKDVVSGPWHCREHLNQSGPSGLPSCSASLQAGRTDSTESTNSTDSADSGDDVDEEEIVFPVVPTWAISKIFIKRYIRPAAVLISPYRCF